MIDNLNIINIYIIFLASGVLTFSTLLFYKEKFDIITLMGASFISLPTAIILSSVSNINIKLTLSIAYLIISSFIVLFKNAKLTGKGTSIITVIATIMVLQIPFDTITITSVENPNPYINITNVVLLLIILISIFTLNKFKKSDVPKDLNTIISFTIITSITLIIAPIEISLFLVSVMVILASYFLLKEIINNGDKRYESLEEQLKKLDDEFNYELRKAVNKQTFHLKEVQEKMSHINKIDNLTKAYNKKAIFNILDDLSADKKTEKFSLIMFDLDKFKTLNDTLGHVQGDICLRTLASIAFESVRDSDYFGRFGGDEFMIILPGADLKTALTIADRFRNSVDKKTNPHFTVSIGLATYPTDGDNRKDLLDVADKGLYRSKEKGRNSVSYHNEKLGKKL